MGYVSFFLNVKRRVLRTFEEDEGVYKGGGRHFEGKKRRKKKEEGILEAVPAVYRERKRGSTVGKKK